MTGVDNVYVRVSVSKKGPDKHPDPEGSKHGRLLVLLHPYASHVNSKGSLHLVPKLGTIAVPRGRVRRLVKARCPRLGR